MIKRKDLYNINNNKNNKGHFLKRQVSGLSLLANSKQQQVYYIDSVNKCYQKQCIRIDSVNKCHQI